MAKAVVHATSSLHKHRRKVQDKHRRLILKGK